MKKSHFGIERSQLRAAWIFLTLSCLLLAVLVGLDWQEKPDQTPPPPAEPLLIMTLDRERLNSAGAWIVLNNQGGQDVSYGLPYSLERNEQGVWSEVESLQPGGFFLIACLLPAGEMQTVYVGWSTLYGRLPPGTYRLGKEFSVRPGIGQSQQQETEEFTKTVEFTLS